MPENIDGDARRNVTQEQIVSVIENGIRVWMIRHEDGSIDVISYERAFFIALEHQARRNLLDGPRRPSVHPIRPGAGHGRPARPVWLDSAPPARPGAGPVPPVRPGAGQPEHDRPRQRPDLGEAENRRASSAPAQVAAAGALSRFVDRSFDAAEKAGSVAKTGLVAAIGATPTLLEKSGHLMASGFGAAMRVLRGPQDPAVRASESPSNTDNAGERRNEAGESHLAEFLRCTDKTAAVLANLRAEMDAVHDLRNGRHAAANDAGETPISGAGTGFDADDGDEFGFSPTIRLAPETPDAGEIPIPGAGTGFDARPPTFDEVIAGNPHLHRHVERVNILIGRIERSIDAAASEIAGQDGGDAAFRRRREEMQAAIKRLQEQCTQLFQKDHPFGERLEMQRIRIGAIFDAISSMLSKKRKPAAEDESQVLR